MKKFFTIIFCFGVFVSTSDASFKLRDYSTVTLENGLEVIFIESKSLPAVSFGLLVKDGSASDLMGQTGLTNLLSSVMVKGTLALDANELADTLSQLGTEIEGSTDEDYSWFQLSGLSPHFQKLLGIFSDVILRPRLSSEEVERQKKIILADLKRKVDQPERYAADSFASFLYGGHPYGHPTEGLEVDITTLDRKDVQRWYDKKLIPNNSVLVVTGFLPDGAKEQIKLAFAGWKKGTVDPKAYPQPPPINNISIRVIDKADANQSQIIMGQFGIKRNNPDYMALRVASNILGGSFSSRLMEQIRVNLGLTYGISSSFDARLDRGPFV